MNTAASNYQETSQFIHNRYEDTAFVIFQQQQKIRQDERRREQQKQTATHNRPFYPAAANYHLPELNRYGNRAVINKESEPIQANDPSPDIKTSPPKVPQTKPSSSTGSQPSVKSSSDRPDHYKRRRRRQQVVNMETSV